MKVLVLNGPNINMLGIREPDIYGRQTYPELLAFIQSAADRLGIEATCIQSNHEGALVDAIQAAYGVYDGIVINPAAYTHTSVALADAIAAVGLPCVEVHLTDPMLREPFRHVSFVRAVCQKTIAGMGFDGYAQALAFLKENNLRQSGNKKDDCLSNFSQKYE